jgi:hypothetical protein
MLSAAGAESETCGIFRTVFEVSRSLSAGMTAILMKKKNVISKKNIEEDLTWYR